MALTDQPYLPLYVDDWSNNQKLKLVSMSANGLMIHIMCQMHKSNSGYGTILLNQKCKQTDKQIKNFALHLAKLLPFALDDILLALTELVDEHILLVNGDLLVCDRMVRDAKLSATRSQSGSLGGKKQKKHLNFASTFASDFAIPKSEANAGIGIENENENENGIEIESGKGGVGEKQSKGVTGRIFHKPEVEQVVEYFASMMGEANQAVLFWNYYESQGWQVGKNKMKDWKAAARGWIVRHKAGQFGDRGQVKSDSKMSRIAEAGVASLAIEINKP